MMRRLIVLDLFSGPAWRDASDMVGHVEQGPSGGWLMVEPDSVRVLEDRADDEQVLRDADQGGPSYRCRVRHTTGGRDRPTVHTLAPGDADLYEEVLLSVGFRLEEPDGIELRKDEAGIYQGYYI